MFFLCSLYLSCYGAAAGKIFTAPVPPVCVNMTIIQLELMT